MKKFVFVMLLLSLLLISIKNVNGQVIVFLSSEYRLNSLEEGKDVFIIRFKNINETTPELINLNFPPIPIQSDVYVRDIPEGFIKYEIREINGKNYLLLSVNKVLTPLEEYEIIIESKSSNILIDVGKGKYRFTAMEYPDFFKRAGFHVTKITISIDLPEDIFKTYQITSVSSNSKIIYGGFNRVDRVEWSFDDPTSQVVAILEFEETINFFLLNIIGASLTAVAFAGLYYINYRLEKKLKSHEIISSPPWSGEILARMKETIRNAKREVLISSPHIYYTDWLTAELQPLMARGVKVRIITWPSYERRQFKSVEEVYEDRKQFFTLKRFLEMFPAGSVKMNDNIHAKMVIVDEKEIIVTTANLTQTGLFENYETAIYAKNERIAKKAKEFFESIWNAKETIELNEETIDAKKAWEEIMKRKTEEETEELGELGELEDEKRKER